ncbi:hypothetical protein BDW59DRAFT_166312 [Aspergillus cavernicola]|uniref:Zn(2)-C6 fungal-type domain-containing protein n=1 Tax=Aspergillus cavernicola TaxID=176166 RepID=A0ABR4HM88_9EURO
MAIAMLTHRTALVACEHCRLRRRRCDRVRPSCSSCASQGVDCVYRPGTDPQPSQLVQELASIRERLDHISRLVQPPSSPSILHSNVLAVTQPPSNSPSLVIKSPYLMQIIGLRSDLSSFLYRLETAIPFTAASPAQFGRLAIPDEMTAGILQKFQDEIHQWYPILHPNFTLHFFETNASGFPHSTKSCLCLLVASIACLSDEHSQSPHFETALSMVPIVFQESSVTSVQCLILFSIYYACRVQPRTGYDYIQAASLRIQPLIKSGSFAQGSPESQLITRLYWTIYMIESETSMHLRLATMGKSTCGPSTPMPMPTNAEIWDYFDDSTSPRSGSDKSVGEVPPPPFYFSTELKLQRLWNKSVTPVMGTTNACAAGEQPDASQLMESLPPMLHLGIPPASEDITTHPMQAAVSRSKYHLYEISIYWPVIYGVIINGFADPEVLPYGPLFFESVTSFLCAASNAIRICPPKTWSLCASIYIISMVAIRALDVPCLRRISQPEFWKYLKVSVDSLQRPSSLSPSVRYMRETLENQMERASLQ